MLKLLRFIRPYRSLLALVLALSFLASLANLFLPKLMADIVDVGIAHGDTTYILQVGAVMLLIALAGTACAVASSFFSAKVATGFGRIVREKTFTQIESFSLHEFDVFTTPSLITRMTNDPTQIQQVLTMLFTMTIGAPMMAIGGVILAATQDATLTWVLVAAMPVVAALFMTVMGRATPLFQAIQGKVDRLNLVLDEALGGVRVIRAFDRAAHEHERFDVADRDLTETSIKVNRLVAFMMPGMMLTLNFTTLAILWFGGIRVNQGHMQIGSLIAFLQYAMFILWSVLMMTVMFVMLPRAAASAKRINEVLDVVPQITDPVKPRTADTEHGYVEFHHVTFSYPGAEEPALLDVSFSAKPGEVTAIIGGTGAGKTTLVNLIPRFYDVDSGRVLVDGVDVRAMRQVDLRAKIGFAPQRALLFSGSIMGNLRYGNPDASDADIQRAASVAQAAEFIQQMPDGVDSIIAQGGINLSGGQKQRLSIARVVARKPEIYVFDDSFSALDFATDARLRAALKAETIGATVFIVSQRVGTIMDADRIIVLDEGRVVGIGKHDELIESCVVYREIVESQLALDTADRALVS
jgi:ATP-binding cassette, subfamily B, multidrug efflux pump